MTHQKVRLVDGDRELVLHDMSALRQDLIYTDLDVSSPAIRENIDDRTDGDGTDDHTLHHGAAAVSLSLRVFDTPATLIDEINSFLHPRSRPYLCVVDDEWAQERRLRLRASQWSAPIPHYGGWMRDVQLQWRAPDGVWEAAGEATAIVNADSGQSAGRVYPLIFPRTYPPTLSVGAYGLTNPGTAWADYRVRLYGPAIGPRWSNDLTGQTLAFTTDLALGAGEFVEIDTREHTAYLNGDPALSRLHLLDFAPSTWWQLAPGANRVRYHPSGEVGIGSVAALFYRPTWL